MRKPNPSSTYSSILRQMRLPHFRPVRPFARVAPRAFVELPLVRASTASAYGWDAPRQTIGASARDVGKAAAVATLTLKRPHRAKNAVVVSAPAAAATERD